MERVYSTIKELRKKKGLTQQDLAEYLNLDVTSISKLENGKIDISLSKLELISTKFEMSVLELLAYPNKVVVNDNDMQSEQLKKLKEKVFECLEILKKME